jgi:hypothetical protein
MKRRWLLLFPFAVLVLAAFWLDASANRQTKYLGLPPTPCIDPTRPLRQDFAFTLRITIDGRPRALDAGIGHDYGNCLHVLHTEDASGLVRLQANDDDAYTLGDFFNTWHWPFGPRLLLGHELEAGQRIQVKVNGAQVETFEQTVLAPGQSIEIDER